MIRTDKISSQYKLSREAALARARLPGPERITEIHEEYTMGEYTPTWIVFRPIFKRTISDSPIPKILVRKNEHRNKFRKRIDPRIAIDGKEEGAREYKNALKDIEGWIREMNLSETPAPACFNESFFSFLNE